LVKNNNFLKDPNPEKTVKQRNPTFKRTRNKDKDNRRFWISLYVIYMVIILLTASAYYAEQSINTRQGGKHSYTLTFDDDGKIEHYTVKMVDKSEPGIIWVTYDGNKHHLDVTTKNILDLTIDCRSIAQEKTREILGYDYKNHENDYKDYFIQQNLFTISVTTDHRIILTMEDIPHPSSVVINNNDEEFSYANGKIIATVPEGSTNVDIYFAATGGNLIALLTTNSKDNYHYPNSKISFDATGSRPQDEIVDYLWDFGDGSYGDGSEITHSYTSPGYYKVVLVVRDSMGRLNRASEIISVYDEDGDNLPDDWEIKYFFDITKEDGSGDPDNDKLTNIDEYGYNTIPNAGDSDNDGFLDGDEIDKNSDPMDPNIKPKDVTEESEDSNFMYILIPVIIAIVLILIVGLIIRSRQMRTRDEDEDLEKAGEGSPEDAEFAEVAGISDAEYFEPYECPECGSEIEEDQKMCYECGAVLEWEEEEDFDDEYEFDSETTSGRNEPEQESNGDSNYEDDDEIFLEDDDEDFEEEKGDYECPTCGATVGEDDSNCPICGEEFE
jgi:PKD repeat protein